LIQHYSSPRSNPLLVTLAHNGELYDVLTDRYIQQSQFHNQIAQQYGTNIIGAVAPKRDGRAESFLNTPIFGSLREAITEVKPFAVSVFVPVRFPNFPSSRPWLSQLTFSSSLPIAAPCSHRRNSLLYRSGNTAHRCLCRRDSNARSIKNFSCFKVAICFKIDRS
jgi:hypothetical protein